MKNALLIAGILICLLSCNHDKNPDVSGIEINIKTERFEKDFFALDTNHLMDGLQLLHQKYPGFSGEFISNILGLNISALSNKQSPEASAIKTFLKDYRALKDSSDKVFGNFKNESEAIKKGLQYLKFYFPKYKTPENIITFIGPIDAFFQTSFGTVGDIITKEGLGIGLQLHLGSNFSSYKNELGQELYPEYISKTFTPDYIAIDCMKNIIDDMFEDKSTGKTLLEQMVEKGKRLYLLDKLLPNVPGYMKISYTEKQLQACYKNEAAIWDFFLSNDLLNNQEQNITKNYIGESPKTQELGEDAPGNLGSFTGWQIVKKYMDKNPAVTPETMMNTDAREIYTATKYKPRN